MMWRTASTGVRRRMFVEEGRVMRSQGKTNLWAYGTGGPESKREVAWNADGFCCAYCLYGHVTAGCPEKKKKVCPR